MYRRIYEVNKKVKWSIISISAATALTFGGLVANNPNASNITSSSDENNTIDEPDVYENDSQTEDRFSRGDHPEWNGENGSEPEFYNEDSSDEDTYNQDSSWDQDQFQQAPSGGFDQGQGSSGASK